MYEWILSFFLIATGVFAVAVGSCQKSYLVVLPFIFAGLIVAPPIGSICAKLVPLLEPFKRRLGAAIILVVVGLFVTYNQCLRSGITSVLETQRAGISRIAGADSEKTGQAGISANNDAAQGESADRGSAESRERQAVAPSGESAMPGNGSAKPVSESAGVKSAETERSRKGGIAGAASESGTGQAGRGTPEKKTAAADRRKRDSEKTGTDAKRMTGISGTGREKSSRTGVSGRESDAHEAGKEMSRAAAPPGEKSLKKAAGGASYTGDMIGGIPHGKGTMKLPAGEQQVVSGPAKKAAAVDLRVFLSRWNYDRREAVSGVIEEYTGEWQRGVPVRKGTFVWSDGDRYSGEFAGRKKQGYGTYRYGHGTRYQGQWSDDRANGEGMIVWSNGDRYTGGWRNDRREGRGTYIWNSGIKYTGQWKGDAMEGRGKISWADGNSYDGEWKNNMRHGKGVYVWKNGDTYRGEFWHNRREGKGTYLWKDGSSYTGEWKNGTRHGEGILKYNGKTIRGEFQNDRLIQER